MIYKKSYDVQKNNQLVINLADRFRSKKKVRVTIENIDESRDEKISCLKKQLETLFFFLILLRLIPTSGTLIMN